MIGALLVAIAVSLISSTALVEVASFSILRIELRREKH